MKCSPSLLHNDLRDITLHLARQRVTTRQRTMGTKKTVLPRNRAPSPAPLFWPHRRRTSRTDVVVMAEDNGADNRDGKPFDTQLETPSSTLRRWAAQEASRCDGGDPDLELCELPEVRDAPQSIYSKSSTLQEALNRGRWLVGLLVLQSSSSFILDSYQELIKQHLVVTLFLTMLVGAGGNAGNQSAIKVIRGLATGSMSASGASVRRVLQQQSAVGLLLGTGLSAAGWIRVYLTNGDLRNATAIALSLFLIVLTSVILGAALPFGLARAGVDPANAGTSIQVVMDVTGVCITCITCHYVLDVFAQSLGIS
jgi:cation transporter-like permease